jgi:ABC-type antimicrobial peptide transport system permease subunit
MVLAFFGIYATVAHVMMGRRREMAIRLTIGATPRAILWLALANAFRYALPGLLVGLAIGAAASQVMTQFLFGVGGFDPVTLLVVGASISAVVMLAALMPARRAAGLDPAVVLRTE